VTRIGIFIAKRLGIAVPRPAELLGWRELKLFELTVVVLLEYGGPMSLDDLYARIAATGFETRAPDLRQSALQAWYGMQPVYRNAQGEFGLNLSYAGIELFFFQVGLRAAAAPPVSPIELALPGDEVPLSLQDLWRPSEFDNLGARMVEQQQILARLREREAESKVDE
jgi:hypothetical protein